MKDTHPFLRCSWAIRCAGRKFFIVLAGIALLTGGIYAAPSVRATETPPVCAGTEALHILLIGKDSDTGSARSDAMILCSFWPEENRLVLTSLLRDLYVQIPGYRDNRLNAAYAAGGMSLLKETLSLNLGIGVDGCLEVDFAGFSRLVDALGGVTLTLRQEEADAINATVPGSLTEGQQRLTGEQALAYSRLRKLDPDGDFSRTRRQQKVLRSLLEGYRDADRRSLLSALKEVLPMLTTDMSRRTLLGYGRRILPGLKNVKITEIQIPAAGTYTFRRIRNMAVIVADMEENRRILAGFLG